MEYCVNMHVCTFQDKSLLILNHIYGWLEEQIHWVALRFLVLGFDLELYSPSEYCMVYWYMYIILWKLAEKAHFRVLIIVHSGKHFVFFYFFPSVSLWFKDQPSVLLYSTRLSLIGYCICMSLITNSRTRHHLDQRNGRQRRRIILGIWLGKIGLVCGYYFSSVRLALHKGSQWYPLFFSVSCFQARSIKMSSDTFSPNLTEPCA